MKKFIASVLFMSLLSHSLVSQTSADALRYSRLLYSGTARFQGMAGAFGAVGADFSVLSTNPGGIGMYKSLEWSITPDLWIANSNSSFNNVTSTDNRVNFALGNIGIVFTIKPYKKNKTGGFQNFNIGFGMNRQNNYNTRVLMQGPNNQSSLMTNYTNVLNSYPGGISPESVSWAYPFDIGLAYDANLIYYDPRTRQYLADALNGGVYQQKTVSTSGSINEFVMSFGGNYNDKLYFGVTFGIPVIRYYESSTYSETRIDPSVKPFQSLYYDQYLETHGTGINFKAGVIYRPIPWLRIGVAAHTPTYYGNMRDSWNSVMTSNFTDSTQWNATTYSPLGSYDYHMATPFRAIGSLAVTIGQFGLITGEYEYVNYNQARFYAVDTSNYSDVNSDIKSKYTSPVNVRFGTEWRIQYFRVRAGFGYYGSPYKSGINSGEQYVISGGIGFRSKYFFADAGYSWSQMKSDYYFYDSALVNPSKNTIYYNNIFMTFGVRF
jgi:hypothetical protein